MLILDFSSAMKCQLPKRRTTQHPGKLIAVLITAMTRKKGFVLVVSIITSGLTRAIAAASAWERLGEEHQGWMK